MTDQPNPIPNDNEPVWDILIRRMHERDAFGRAKYGTPLQVDNGRIDEEDILDELLDAAVYTLKAKLQRQKREERIRDEEQERIARLVEGVSPDFLRVLEGGKLREVITTLVRMPRDQVQTGGNATFAMCPD